MQWQWQERLNMKTDYKDIAIRAGKTFIQTVLATLAVSGNKLDKATITGAIAAGVSAVWNFVNQTK